MKHTPIQRPLDTTGLQTSISAAVIATGCITIATLLVACATPPRQPTAEPVVELTDTTLSRQAHAEMISKFPPYADQAIQQYVSYIGSRLAEQAPRTTLPLHFTVLDSPGIFAYSFSHGDIVISRGLLAHFNTEAELAAVLAHEIGHVLARHQAQLMADFQRTRDLEIRLARRFDSAQAREAMGTLSLARLRGYSREHEIDADTRSEEILAKAGYPREAMAHALKLFERIEDHAERYGQPMWDLPEEGNYDGVFSTHPSTRMRLDQASRRNGNKPLQPLAEDPVYLRRLDGLLFGIAAKHGVLREGVFIDHHRKITIKLPDDWYVFGVGDRLAVAPRDHKSLITLAPHTRGIPAEEALRTLAHGQPLQDEKTFGKASTRSRLATVAATDRTGVMVAIIDHGEHRLSLVALRAKEIDEKSFRARIETLLENIHPAQPAELALPAHRLRIRQTTPANGPAHNSPVSPAAWLLLNQLSASATTGTRLLKYPE